MTVVPSKSCLIFTIDKVYIDHVLFTIPPVPKFKVLLFGKPPYFWQTYYRFEYCISYFQGKFDSQSCFRVNKLKLYVFKSEINGT